MLLRAALALVLTSAAAHGFQVEVDTRLRAPSPATGTPSALSDPRVRYFGQADLLELDAFFGDRFDDFVASSFRDQGSVISGVLGPAWIEPSADGWVLTRTGLCSVSDEEQGTPVVVMHSLSGEGLSRRFADPLGEMIDLALPDVTGDGWPEACSVQHVYGARSPWWTPDPVSSEVGPAGLRISALDVATGETVWSTVFGKPSSGVWITRPRSVRDLDADGHADLLVAKGVRGSYDYEMLALSSASGTTIRRWTHTGRRIASVRDWTTPRIDLIEDEGYVRDGVPALLVSVAYAEQTFLELPLNDQTGARALASIHRGDYGVRTLGRPHSLGDLDGDGYVDVLVGAAGSFYNCDDDTLVHDEDGKVNARWHNGAVLVVDTRTGREMHAVTGEACRDIFGFKVIPYEDLDGDGTPEVLVTARGARDRQIRLVDIAKGAVVAAWPQQVVGVPGLGIDLATVADQDGDGHPEVLVTRGRGSAYERCESINNALTSGVLCVSSRAFVP